jgi:DNA-binding transcriptional ArsR family regulator
MFTMADMSPPLFHFEYQGQTGWEALGSGRGDGPDGTGSALDDLRSLYGGEMPIGAYRCIEANGGDARWREFSLGLDGVAAGATEPLIPRSRSLADGEAVEIAKTLTHPLRLAILRALRDGGRISPVEFARESGDQLANVSHHLKALRRAGVIQIVDTSRNRGGVVHHYALGGPRAVAVVAMLDLLEGLETVPASPSPRGF